MEATKAVNVAEHTRRGKPVSAHKKHMPVSPDARLSGDLPPLPEQQLSERAQLHAARSRGDKKDVERLARYSRDVTVIEELAGDKSEDLRGAVLSNPSVTRAAIEQVASSRQTHLRNTAAKHPRTSRSALQKLAGERRDRDTMHHAQWRLKHGVWVPEHGADDAWFAAASEPAQENARRDLLEHHPSDKFEIARSEEPHVAEWQLETLMSDSDHEISRAAEANLLIRRAH